MIKFIGIAAGILSLSSAAIAIAAPAHFSFFGVEFAPHDQRVPLAEAYVARTMAPGTPLSAAVEAAKKAGAKCGKPDTAGVVSCTESSLQRPPGRGVDDVLWTVRLTPDANSLIARAKVTRSVAGM